jgi:hypothetical protein
MEKYILNLLKENKRIIIPDFGAFIIRPLNPPEIAFNGLLTFNDGILTEYVSKQSGISYVEAASKISDYAEKLKTDLHQYNRLTFNEIGWVWTDDYGEMQFTPWKDTTVTTAKSPGGLKALDSILKANESPENRQPAESIIYEKGLDPTIISADQTPPFTLDETLKEVDIDATKDVLTQNSSDSVMDSEKMPDESFTLEETDKTATVVQTSPEKPVIHLTDISGSQNEIIKTETVIEPVIQRTGKEDDKDSQFDEKIMASISAIKAKSESKNSDRSKNIPQELSPNQDWRRSEIKSFDSSRSKKEKKKRSWILPVLIIGLAIILAGAAWFIFPDQVKNILSSNRQPSENEMGEQLYEQEQIPEQEVVPEPAQVPVQDASGNPGADHKYYIVAGRFKNKTNADKYVASLLSKGFNAELFRTDDNLYTVSFSSFLSRAQAEEELKHIRQTTESEAWILLY